MHSATGVNIDITQGHLSSCKVEIAATPFYVLRNDRQGIHSITTHSEWDDFCLDELRIPQLDWLSSSRPQSSMMVLLGNVWLVYLRACSCLFWRSVSGIFSGTVAGPRSKSLQISPLFLFNFFDSLRFRFFRKHWLFFFPTGCVHSCIVGKHIRCHGIWWDLLTCARR